MDAKRLARLTVVTALVGLIVSGCTAASIPSAQLSGTESSSPQVIPSDLASIEPTTTPTSSPDETQTDSPGPDPTMTPPPDAMLTVDGGDPVVGEQGTWSWGNAVSDAPWLPGFPILVAANERLTFQMAEPVQIDSWQVARVLPSGVPDGDDPVGMADGNGNAISFAVPPQGSWSVAVTVRFADNLGDAVYYWAVTVD